VFALLGVERWGCRGRDDVVGKGLEESWREEEGGSGCCGGRRGLGWVVALRRARGSGGDLIGDGGGGAERCKGGWWVALG